MGASVQRRCSRPGIAAGIGLLALIASGCGSSGPPDVPITITDFAFDPKQISVQSGQRVGMVLQNKGAVPHTFAVPQLRIAEEVAPGQTKKVEFAAPNGAYKLVCTMPGHEEQGMVGEVRAARR